ncbi:MAG: glucose-1-phosphate cytidylyltransferase [Ignavibacteria bacterium]|nr:glucose-1-phosphate cytidylyltransferase [Ignavibacteria bacterium]
MKVVILCGGLGTRLREETEYKPKPMVEIGGMPILWHIMKIYSHYGFNDFVLALGYKGYMIKDFFLNYKYYNNDFTIDIRSGKIENSGTRIENWKITLVDTGIDSMTGYRLKLCDKFIDDDTFMMTYGDAVSNISIDKLLEFSLKRNTIGTVTGVYPPSRFGDLECEENSVIKFKEKLRDTKSKNPINGGFFVFKKSIFDHIPDDINCDLEREPMNRLTETGQLSVFRHEGYWQCMDTYRDFIQLNEQWKNKPHWKIWN